MSSGRYFEDFSVGETLVHATPRTLSAGDAALYQALYGGRHLPQSSQPAAQAMGYADRPLPDWLVFHIVFGKSVPDVSRHAMANLGYAEGRFLEPVYAGDTLSAHSEIIGLKENSNGKTGLVMARTTGFNAQGAPVLSYIRWVMVKKHDAASPPPDTVWPTPTPHLTAAELHLPEIDFSRLDTALSGSARRFDDYEIGEKLSHGSGVTMEEAEHMMATRAYQNTAEVHFDALAQQQSRSGQRLIYGGHIISHAHAMSFNGLENMVALAGLNGGSHAGPVFAGDTLYGWSQVLDKAELAGRDDVGALRVRHIMLKNRDQSGFPGPADRGEGGQNAPEMVLDLDIWGLMPR